MRYCYRCSLCNEIIEIDKPMEDASDQEYCDCGQELERVYTSPRIRTGDGLK